MLLQIALFHSFLWWVIFHCIYVPHLHLHSFFDGHLDCFCVLAVANSATVNIGVHTSFQIIFFPGYMPRVWLLDHVVFLHLVFKETSILFSIVAAPIYKLVLQWKKTLVAQLVKNPPAMWKTWVSSPGWEDPLKKGKATHSSILAWRTPWTV